MGLFVWIIWLIVSVWADPAAATTRWVIPGSGATGCSNGSTNYSPITNMCGSGSDVVHTSHSNAMAAMASCDVAIYRAGSYSGQATISNAQANAKSGTPSCFTTFRSYHENLETAILTGVSASPTLMAFQFDGTEANPTRYIEVSYFEINMSASGGLGGCWYMRGVNHHHRFVHNSCHDVATVILMAQSVTGQVGDHYIAYNHLYNLGLRTDLDPPGKNALYGMGNRTIAERNVTHDACNGFSVFSSVGGLPQHDVVIRDNVFYRMGRRDLYPGMVDMQCQTAIAQPSIGSNPTIERNIIYDSFTQSTDAAIRIYLSYNGTQCKISNNTIFNTIGKGISVETGTNCAVKNNITYQTTSTPIAITGGTGSQSNNLTTDPSFADSANGNLTLQAGSAAIDCGVDVGLPYNGSAPDCGAYETFTANSAVASGSIIEVTMAMNTHTPVVPTMAGWSVSCTPNPTACPTPTVTSVSLKTGTSSTVQIVFSGGDCSADQTWEAIYDSATGATTDSIGLVHQQELLSTTLEAVNNCTGGGGPSYPSGQHIHYTLDDGSGATANDSTANNLDGTLTNSPTWGAGKYGSGVTTASGTSQHVAIPYGNTVNPSTQSLTIAFGVYITDSSVGGIDFGSPVGSNQRLYISRQSGTWRIAIQSTNASVASELSVQTGWNRVCLTMDSGTDTATLHINGVASASAGGMKAYTSYALAGNLQLGRIDGNNAPGATYDQFMLWTSVVSCADDFNAWEPTSSPWTGTLEAVAMRFYGAKTTKESALIPLAPINTHIIIPAGAAFVVAIQTDGTDSNPTAIAEKLYVSCAACPSAGSWLPVPDTATTDGMEFWGSVNEVGLLSGAHGANLSGALTHVNGGTNRTAESVPVFDLAQDNSTVMRWMVRVVPGTPLARTFCFSAREQTGVELDGETPTGGICATVGPSNAHVGF